MRILLPVLATTLLLAACGEEPEPRLGEDGELLVPEDAPDAVPADVNTAVVGPAEAAPAPTPVRLTALDCGRIEVGDLDLFDVGGAYEGQTDTFADT